MAKQIGHSSLDIYSQTAFAYYLQLRSYILATHDTPFPTKPIHILDLINARMDERCHKTVFDSTLSALQFIEKGGGVLQADRLSEHPSVQALLAEARLDVTSGYFQTETGTSGAYSSLGDA